MYVSISRVILSLMYFCKLFLEPDDNVIFVVLQRYPPASNITISEFP